MIERQTELKRRYHRKNKMAKLKAKLTTGGATGDARAAILARIKKLSPTWTEASLQPVAAVAPGDRKSRLSERFPRLSERKMAFDPPRLWPPMWRRMSPPPLDSTLVTSAPRSESMADANGPDITRVRSKSRMPSSGRCGSPTA